MKTIKVCEIGENWRLGQALGNQRHETCWAVECDRAIPGALEYGGKYYRRFEKFKEAESFCAE